jgi:hypothetical protein
MGIEMPPFSFSAFPQDWNDILKAPVFIISTNKERYEICKNRAIRAGFVGDIQQSMGVNRNDEKEMDQEISNHPYLPSYKRSGKNIPVVLLVHLKLWKHILENNIAYAVIFEDDILFHTEWQKYASMYYDTTPKDCDMIYLGHHCGNVYPNIHVTQVPVYCTHAYMITYDGVKKLYEMLTNYPFDDFGSGEIDMMIVKIQINVLFHKTITNYKWYVWNTEMFPDPINEKYKHPCSITKDFGLVFQQNPFFKLDTDE